jgi:hypothetical protein
VAGGAVDRGHLVPGAHVEVERGLERPGGVQQELRAVGDLVAHVVGQTAVGEGDVLATLEDDDLGGLVEAARAGGRRHAAGDPADDHDAGHGCAPVLRASAPGVRPTPFTHPQDTPQGISRRAP